MNKAGPLICIFACLWLGCGSAPGAPDRDAGITPGDMRARISFLAADRLEGRATPSRGLEIAAEYIASEYRRLGLDTPADGDFVLRYQLVMTEMGGGWALSLSSGSRQASLRYRADFWGLPWAAGRVEGPLRFVGSIPPSVGSGVPAGAVWVARLGTGVLPRDWVQAASNAGAVGLLFVVPEERQPQLRKWLGDGERTYELGYVEPHLPAAVVSAPALAAALQRVGLEGQTVSAMAAQAESGARARLAADLQVETASAPNVLAILPGSDPRLREEFVLISAHMDGLGIGSPIDGDSIYNGADDNASGTAAVLEIAEAAATLEQRPKRSLAFLNLSGEEMGLLGSGWFVENPPIPLDRIVANLNIDMIGRNWEDTIAVVGKPFSTLGMLVDSVAVAHRNLKMTVVDDRWPAEGFFFRSDHFNFARKGIPSVFFFNGVHEDYHRPSDETERIKFNKAARISRLVFEVALALANAQETPRWDPRARAAIVEDGY